MRNIRIILWKLAVVFVSTYVLFLYKANGGIILGFNWQTSLDIATHVVLVTEGNDVDGILQVIESWKGDLHTGDTLEIPELAQFASTESRTIKRWAGDSAHGVVTGDRMVLFLIKSLVWADGKTEKLKTRWLPSLPYFVPMGAGRAKPQADFDLMRICVVWIEEGKTYAYSQVMNPGPLLLTNSELGNTDEARKHVKDYLDNQNVLRTINAIPDPAVRVTRAIALARENPDCMGDVVEIVAGAGEAALPGLRQMLNDASFERIHPTVVLDLGDVAGKDAGSELTALLKRELVFWHKTAPGLEKGWWNIMEPVERREMLRNRYGITYGGLLKLKELGYKACKDTVIEFRDYWQSLPQLKDYGQINETCDLVLKSFDDPPQAQIKHAWGFELAASEPDPVRRAEALVPFLAVGEYRAHERAFNALTGCGVPALTPMRSILKDEKCASEHNLVLRNIAKVGGIRVGAEITQLIVGELAFMKQNDLVKTAKSWNELSQDARNHFGKLEEAVASLELIAYPGAISEVSEVRNYVNEVSLAGFSDLHSIKRACESYLFKYPAH